MSTVAGKNIDTLEYLQEIDLANDVLLGLDASEPIIANKLKKVVPQLIVAGLVENKVDKITGKGLSTEDYTTAEKTKLSGLDTGDKLTVSTTEKATWNGKADLVDGKVPSTQLPSYVDDVLEYANFAALPVTGETGKIYVTLDTNITYRWSGTAYVEISQSLALGETSSTAYRGDRGKTAYDHSQTTHDKSLVGLGNVDNTSDANKPVSTAQQTALDLKVDKITGKGLSTEDYTTAEKTKLSGLTKATGTEIDTGTDDAKFATPKSIADSKLVFESQIQNSGLIYADGAGSATAITCTFSPAPSAWSAIGKVLIKVPADNTGAVTLNPNSLGARTIKKNYNQDLDVGNIKANQIIELWNDGTNLQLLSPVSNAGGGSSPSLYKINTTFLTYATTFTDVTGLSVSLSANKKYFIQGLVQVRAFSPDGVTLNIPGLTGSKYSGYVREGVSGGVIEDFVRTDYDTSWAPINGMAATVFMTFQMQITIGSTAGTWTIQIKNSTANGGYVECLAGSYFIVQEIL